MGVYLKNVIISGAGEVGFYTAEVLHAQGHSITVIDTDVNCLKRLENSVDARVILGSCCHANILKDAQIEKCDALIAATSLDEINFLTATIARKMGANKVIARIHDRNYVRNKHLNYSEVFDIHSVVCPEELTSRAVCAKLHDPGVAAVQRFAGDAIELHQFIIKPNTPAFHKPLSEVALPPGVRIISVRRGEQALIPGASTLLARGDLITIVVPSQYLEVVKSFFQPVNTSQQQIVIAGASSISEWILCDIDPKRFRVRLFENNLEIAEQVASQHPEITVLNADPVDVHIFEAEQLEAASAFIAAGINEEHNILGALQAKSKGVDTTFAMIHNSTYLSALEGIGIDYPFSPRIEAAKEFLRLIDDAPIRKLSTLENGAIVVYELTVRKKAKGVGQSLRELNFPRATIVCAIQREEVVLAPVAEDRIEADDTLIVIGPPEMEKTLEKMFI